MDVIAVYRDDGHEDEPWGSRKWTPALTVTTDTETTTCRRCMKRLLRACRVEDEPRVSMKQRLRVAESGVDVVAVYRDDGHGNEP